VKGLALWHLGHPDQSLSCEQTGLALADQLAYPFTLACTRWFSAYQHLLRREVGPARELARDVVRLSADHGFVMFSTWGAFLVGWTLAGGKGAGQGIEQMEREIAAWRESGGHVLLPAMLATVGEAYAGAGRAETGLMRVDEGLQLEGRTGEHCWEAELYRLKGELLLIAGADGAQAEDCLRRAIDVARHQDARAWELRAAISLGRLWKRQGRVDEARELVGRAYGWFTEGFDTADLRDARALLDSLG
jgi:adenylate cyclase